MNQVEEKEKDKKENGNGKREFSMQNDYLFKSIALEEEQKEYIVKIVYEFLKIPKEILRKADIVSMEFAKSNVHEKGKRGDIILRIADEKIYILLEMNQWKYDVKKNMDYAFTTYIQNTTIGKNRYPKVYTINIDGVNQYDVKEPILTFEMANTQYLLPECPDITCKNYHFILENVTNKIYNVSETLRRFASVLKAKSIKEVERLSKGDEEFMKMSKKVKNFMSDEGFLQYYDQAEIEKGEKIFLYNDGKKEGEKIGEERGIIKTAIELIKNGVSLEIISKSTGLSLKELQDLML